MGLCWDDFKAMKRGTLVRVSLPDPNAGVWMLLATHDSDEDHLGFRGMLAKLNSDIPPRHFSQFASHHCEILDPSRPIRLYLTTIDDFKAMKNR